MNSIHPMLAMLAQAQAESTTNFWVTVLIVTAVSAVFIGLLIYAAFRSREEGKHPQMEDED